MKFSEIASVLDIAFGCWVNKGDSSYWFICLKDMECDLMDAEVSYITVNSKCELVIELVEGV